MEIEAIVRTPTVLDGCSVFEKGGQIEKRAARAGGPGGPLDATWGNEVQPFLYVAAWRRVYLHGAKCWEGYRPPPGAVGQCGADAEQFPMRAERYFVELAARRGKASLTMIEFS